MACLQVDCWFLNCCKAAELIHTGLFLPPFVVRYGELPARQQQDDTARSPFLFRICQALHFENVQKVSPWRGDLKLA